MTEFIPEAPEPDDVTAPWWEPTRHRQLAIQFCSQCESYQHPPRALCAACGRVDFLEFRPSAGRAVVDSWTIVHRSPVPTAPVPYVIARVQIEEGPIVLTQLLDDVDWRIGDRVVLDWLPMADGRALPAFRRDVP